MKKILLMLLMLGWSAGNETEASERAIVVHNRELAALLNAHYLPLVRETEVDRKFFGNRCNEFLLRKVNCNNKAGRDFVCSLRITNGLKSGLD